MTEPQTTPAPSSTTATPAHELTHAADQAEVTTNPLAANADNDTAALTSLLANLTNEQGFDDSQIKLDAASLEYWGKDWTKHFAPAPSAIVFPKSTEQVQALVKLANEYNIVITPSGGRTGLSAGAVASNGEIVVSLDKMNKIGQFYPADRLVEVQAGVITEQLQQFAESQGLYYPVDLLQQGQAKLAVISALMLAALK